jgi:hypothetical protein
MDKLREHGGKIWDWHSDPVAGVVVSKRLHAERTHASDIESSMSG